MATLCCDADCCKMRLVDCHMPHGGRLDRMASKLTNCLAIQLDQLRLSIRSSQLHYHPHRAPTPLQNPSLNRPLRIAQRNLVENPLMRLESRIRLLRPGIPPIVILPLITLENHHIARRDVHPIRGRDPILVRDVQVPHGLQRGFRDPVVAVRDAVVPARNAVLPADIARESRVSDARAGEGVQVRVQARVADVGGREGSGRGAEAVADHVEGVRGVLRASLVESGEDGGLGSVPEGVEA